MASTPPDDGLAPAWSPPPFLLSIDLVEARIAVYGELDVSNVHRLVEAMAVMTNSASQRWSIDTAGVTFCDAAGLRGLMAVQRRARESRRTLLVTRSSRWMNRLLDLVGLTALITAADDDLLAGA
jgi:anti-anti-sigma factor